MLCMTVQYRLAKFKLLFGMDIMWILLHNTLWPSSSKPVESETFHHFHYYVSTRSSAVHGLSGIQQVYKCVCAVSNGFRCDARQLAAVSRRPVSLHGPFLRCGHSSGL